MTQASNSTVLLAIRERREARTRQKKLVKQQELDQTKALHSQLARTFQQNIDNGHAATQRRYQILQTIEANIDDIQRYQAFVQNLRLERASDRKELNRVANVLEDLTREKNCADANHAFAFKGVEKTKLLSKNQYVDRADEEGEC